MRRINTMETGDFDETLFDLDLDPNLFGAEDLAMAEVPDDVEFYQMVLAPRRIKLTIQATDYHTGEKLFSQENFESDIEKLRQFFRQHGQDLQPSKMPEGPQHSPPTLLPGDDGWIPVLVKKPRAMPTPGKDQEMTAAGSGQDGIDGNESEVALRAGACDNAKDKEKTKTSQEDPIPSTSAQPGQSDQSQQLTSASATPEQSKKSYGRRTKRPRMTPVEIPDTSTSRPRRNIEPSARYKDARDYQKRQKNVSDPGSLPPAESQRRIQRTARAKTAPNPSTTSSRPSSLTSGIRNRKDLEDIEWMEIEIKIANCNMDEFRKKKNLMETRDKTAQPDPPEPEVNAPGHGNIDSSNELAQANSEVKNPEEMLPLTSPITITDADPTLSSLDFKITPTPTKFGKISQLQRVLARRRHDDKFYTFGKILSKYEDDWLVNFCDHFGDEMVISEKYMIPIDYLGKGVPAIYRYVDPANGTYRRSNVILNGHFNIDSDHILRYKFLYNGVENHESGVGQWENFEIDGVTLEIIHGQWEDHKQEIAAAAAEAAAQNQMLIRDPLEGAPIIENSADAD